MTFAVDNRIRWWIAVATVMLVESSAFVTHPFLTSNTARFNRNEGSERKFKSYFGPPSSALKVLITVELEKPLGMILEEIEEGLPCGVKVEELSDAGSAYTCQYKDDLVGLRIASVMSEDVTQLGFDDVMSKIIDAPSPVQIQFDSLEGIDKGDGEEEPPKYEVGTEVSLTVIQEGKPVKVISNARVGDNLRKTLLDNDVELYRGLKKKLGNCGGGGQCTFCAVDLTEADGWAEYEDPRIAKFGPTARLACMNLIMGPATIRVP